MATHLHFICVVNRGDKAERILVEALDEAHARKRLAERDVTVIRIERANDELVTRLTKQNAKAKDVSPQAADSMQNAPRKAIDASPGEKANWDMLSAITDLAYEPPMDPATAWRQAQELADMNSTEQSRELSKPPAIEVKFTVGSRDELNQMRRRPEDIRKKLDAMIGMADVKADIAQLEAMLKVNAMRAAKHMKPLRASAHYVFRGRPGTGKTTIARLLGELFAAYGVLEKGHVVETDRSGLVGEYLGHTAMKVDAIFKQAMGGVLFIDEAYSLARKNSGSPDMFGLEAIDALLKRMEDHRDKIVVIVAGYPQEMNEFIASNPGMESRFTRYIDFPDYTPHELVAIFERMALENGFVMDRVAKGALFPVIHRLHSVRTERFGNARTVRNLLEASIGNLATRLAHGLGSPTEIQLSTLTAGDIAAS